ncbi:MAG: dicarboxylate/amino acid:cation symporter [Candidatus Margulisiibacteriota bacterium]
MSKSVSVWAAILSVTVAAILQVLHLYDLAPVSQPLLYGGHLVASLGLLAYGFQKRSLTVFIFISMVIGILVGHDLPAVAVNLKILSEIFLHLIKTIIAPLLFATLVVGIAGHSNLKQVGRMGLKSIIYFELVTTIALVVGLFAINVSKAGVGIHMPANLHAEVVQVQKQSFHDIVLHIFPENIAKSVANGEILQIVVFSIFFAIGLAMVKEKYKAPMVSFFEGLSEVMFKFTDVVMLFAPIGVGGAIAYTVGNMGLGVLVNLFQLLLTLYVALIVFVLCVLLPIALIVRVPIKAFLKAVAEPVVIAFGTASSESALPKAMEGMESIGVPRKIVSFVIPTGYSFNLDGTTLYLSLATVFVAQAAGIHLSIMHQLLIGFTLMLTSKGVAGVARASLVILLGTAAQFNLPVEPIFLILGIDALMDMGRTAVNVLGNCLATVVVAKWEGEFTPIVNTNT